MDCKVDLGKQYINSTKTDIVIGAKPENIQNSLMAYMINPFKQFTYFQKGYDFRIYCRVIYKNVAHKTKLYSQSVLIILLMFSMRIVKRRFKNQPFFLSFFLTNRNQNEEKWVRNFGTPHSSSCGYPS